LDFQKAFDSVEWDFLLDILRAKGFSHKWILWIENILKISNTRLVVIGKEGKTIKCKRGLRQGDPLSPLLFDLVVDCLNIMLKKAMGENRYQGINMRSGGEFALLQYADDTLVCGKASLENIVNL